MASLTLLVARYFALAFSAPVTIHHNKTFFKPKHPILFPQNLPSAPCHDKSCTVSQHADEMRSHDRSHALLLRMYSTRGSVAVPFRPVHHQLTHQLQYHTSRHIPGYPTTFSHSAGRPRRNHPPRTNTSRWNAQSISRSFRRLCSAGTIDFLIC